MERLHTVSAEETYDAGRSFAATLTAGDVVRLEGPLGSGKTTFAQGVAAGLGVKEVVNSPTFKLVGEYNSEPPLYHFDFYRIGSASDAMALGLDHYFGGEGISLVEWSDLFPEVIPEWAVRVSFARLAMGERNILIERKKAETVSH